MIISDLSYLEYASEGSSITGGKTKKGGKNGLDIALDIAQKQNQGVSIELDPKTLQTNVGIITQVGVAVATAVTLAGKAIADANVENNTK